MTKSHITREDCVLRYLLDNQAAALPNKVFLKNDDGREWTYTEARREVLKAAGGLQALGVKQGDHVLCWMPNSPEMLFVWFAINYIGAVFVPVNLAYRGRLLEHAVSLSDAKVGVVHADLAQRFADIELAQLKDIVIFGGAAATDSRLAFHAYSILEQERPLAPLERPIEPWDDIYIIFTSGTTGPSKAVLCSYAMMLYGMPEAYTMIDSDTRYLIVSPLFHAAATGFGYAMLIRGGSIAMVESFKTDQFWDVIRRTQTTFCSLLGVVPLFLLKEPPSPRDGDHCLKVVTTGPWGEHCLQFAKRFGVDMYTAFSMSELSIPLVSGLNPPKMGIAGRVRKGFEMKIVDEHDFEVPVGQVGEAVIRSDLPWAITSGYYKNPEATAKAWRNGWFHTGDAMRVDVDGDFFFIDRLKDSIRRRGENISSFDIETVVQEHPAVRECAAIAVRAESEDEVMLCAALQPNMKLDFEEFVEFLRPKMAHFMVPRFFRILPELPKTPNGKIQKAELRRDGVTSDTWDREAAGIIIKREKIGSR